MSHVFWRRGSCTDTMSLQLVAALIQYVQRHVQSLFSFFLVFTPTIKTQYWYSYTDKVLGSFYV